MRVKAQKPYHAIIQNGVVVDVGSGAFYMLREGQSAQEFDTKKECALNPLVAAWELSKALPILEDTVQAMKSQHAYAGKEYDARMLMRSVVDGVLAVGVYAPDKFPHLALEVEAQGCTPLEAAESILMAVARADANDMGTIAQEQKRLQLRERVKTIKEALNNGE